MVHYPLMLAHWLSTGPMAFQYTTVFYWPTGYFCGTLSSPIGPLAIFMEHYCIPMAHWLSLWYTIPPIAPWLSLWYTSIFYWPTGYLNGTLLSSTSPLAIPMVCYSPILTHWLSICYTTIFFLPAGYLCDTLSSRIGPLSIPTVHFYLLLAHWISLWYTAIFY